MTWCLVSRTPSAHLRRITPKWRRHHSNHRESPWQVCRARAPAVPMRSGMRTPYRSWSRRNDCGACRMTVEVQLGPGLLSALVRESSAPASHQLATSQWAASTTSARQLDAGMESSNAASRKRYIPHEQRAKGPRSHSGQTPSKHVEKHHLRCLDI